MKNLQQIPDPAVHIWINWFNFLRGSIGSVLSAGTALQQEVTLYDDICRIRFFFNLLFYFLLFWIVFPKLKLWIKAVCRVIRAAACPQPRLYDGGLHLVIFILVPHDLVCHPLYILLTLNGFCPGPGCYNTYYSSQGDETHHQTRHSMKTSLLHACFGSESSLWIGSKSSSNGWVSWDDRRMHIFSFSVLHW